MDHDRSRSIAIGVCLATLVICIGATALVALGLSADVGTAWGFRGFGVLLAITCGAVGILISVRVPGNRFGWLFAAIGLASALQELIAAYVIYGGLVAPGTLPWIRQIAWFETWDWVPVAGSATTFLLLLFPDGRLPSDRWRPVAWLAVGAIAVASIVLSVQPGPIEGVEYLDNPLGMAAVGDLVGPLGAIGFAALIVAVFLSVTSMVVRFRRSHAAEREQLKWFASAAVLAGLVFAALGALDSANKAFQILTIVAFLGLPISAGIAILRYRLYDIDRIISRTIAYALVTGLLLAAYGGLIVVLQEPLATVAGTDTILVAGSTLIVAVLFNPVRVRLQDIVDRRFNRTHWDAELTARRFSGRLRDQLDLEAISGELARTTSAALDPATTSVWLRSRVRVS